jgi:hypothetical protein
MWSYRGAISNVNRKGVLHAKAVDLGIICFFWVRLVMGTAKRKRRASRAWSKEDIKNLRGFAKERLSGTQAAKKLRRTPGAVAQKAMKLGIWFRSINRKRRKGADLPMSSTRAG